MLQRIKLLQVDVLTVLCQLRKGLRNAQIERVTLSLGFDNTVSVELQTHTSDEAIGFHRNQTNLLGPAQLSKWRQLVFRQVGGDDQREL